MTTLTRLKVSHWMKLELEILKLVMALAFAMTLYINSQSMVAMPVSIAQRGWNLEIIAPFLTDRF